MMSQEGVILNPSDVSTLILLRFFASLRMTASLRLLGNPVLHSRRGIDGDDLHGAVAYFAEPHFSVTDHFSVCISKEAAG